MFYYNLSTEIYRFSQSIYVQHNIKMVTAHFCAYMMYRLETIKILIFFNFEEFFIV